MKLSPFQQYVVEKMREGWRLETTIRELYPHDGDTVVTLRKSGFASEGVRYATFDRLRDLGVIVWASGDGRGRTIYKLPEKTE